MGVQKDRETQDYRANAEKHFELGHFDFRPLAPHQPRFLHARLFVRDYLPLEVHPTDHVVLDERVVRQCDAPVLGVADVVFVQLHRPPQGLEILLKKKCKNK